MAVPSREEFAEFLKLAETPISLRSIDPSPGVEAPPDSVHQDADSHMRRAEYYAEMEERYSEMISLEDAASYLSDAERQRQAIEARLVSSPAWQWVHQQKEFQRARDIVYGQKVSEIHPQWITSRVNPDDYARWSARRTIERALGNQGPWTSPAERVRSMLRARAGVQLSEHWPVRCVRALMEYFYAPTADDMVEIAREIKGAHAEFVAAARRYIELADRFEQLGLFEAWARAGGYLRKEVADDRVASAVSIVHLPVKRKSANAREKLFAFRMWNINRDILGKKSGCPGAISELMDLEGFARRPDMRTIERYCSGFRLARQKHFNTRAKSAGAA